MAKITGLPELVADAVDGSETTVAVKGGVMYRTSTGTLLAPHLAEAAALVTEAQQLIDGVSAKTAKIDAAYGMAVASEAAISSGAVSYFVRAAGSSSITNVYSIGRFFDVGTHIPAGAIFNGIEAETSCPATAVSVVLKVWKRPLVVGGAANPNLNADFGAGGDVLVATFTFTPAGLGLTTANKWVVLPFDDVVAEAGYSYGIERYALNASNAKLTMGYGRYGAGTAATPTSSQARLRGLTHATAAGVMDPVPVNYAMSDGLVRRNAPLKSADVQAKAEAAASAARRLERSAARRRCNFAALLSQAARFPLPAPGNGIVFVGDSNTEQLDSLGIAVGNTIADRVADYLPGVTIHRKGLPARDSNYIASFCDQAEGTTGPSVGGVVETALTAAQKAMLAILMMGTNDTIVPGVSATILANMKRVQAVFGDPARVLHRGYIVSTANSTGTIGYAESRRLADLAKSEFGGRFIDTQYEQAKAASIGTDRQALKRGQIPTEFQDGLSPSLHWNNAFSEEGAFMLAGPVRAMCGGAPYVHEDVFPIFAGSAAGTAIGAVRFLGGTYPGQFRIVSGNNDDIVRLDPATGALTRGAGKLTDDIRQIEVQIGTRGNIAAITLMRCADGTAPIYGVRVKPTLASVLAASLQGVANGPEQTIAICLKLNGDQTSAGLLHQGAGTRANLSVLGKVLAYNPFSTADALLGVAAAPQALNPYEYNWYFFARKADGTIYARTNKSAPVVVAGAAGDLPLSTLSTLWGVSGPGGGNLDVSYKSLWIASSFLDFFTVDTSVDLIRHATTGVPLDIGSGTISGVTPYLYPHGNARDAAMGRNFGTGGNLYGPTYYGVPEDLGFEDDLS